VLDETVPSAVERYRIALDVGGKVAGREGRQNAQTQNRRHNANNRKAH